MISRKCWTAAICLGMMTLVGGDRLSATEPVEMQADGLKVKMEAEGWTPIADSVFERQLGPNKVEHMGFGREGLAWTIKGLTRQLESLMLEHESYPSEDLEKIIDDLSVKIAKAKRDLKNAPQGITSMTEAVTGPTCSSICYSATADAYPLPSAQGQGVGAVAQAKFNSACGYSGDTYTYAYVRATTQAEGTKVYIHDDPRTGTNVTSSATATMSGGQDCYSRAYSAVTSSALEISYYTVEDENYSCPAPILDVTMSGPSSAPFTTATCSTQTWSASPSGGTTPYSYKWYYNGTQVGTGASYSRSVCYNDADFTIQATATDNSNPTQSKSVSRAVDVSYTLPSLNVTMSGPTSADFTSATCSTQTWSASPTGGTTPYSYNWYYNGAQVGTGASYSRSVCYSDADFTVQATVTDSSSPVQSKSVSRAVDVTYSPPAPSVTINGSAYEYFAYMGSCRNVTWTSTVSGGVSPYAYQWKIGTTVVGTGSSYTKSVCRSQQPGFTLSLTVTGGNSATATDTHSVTVEREPYDECGGGICP